MEKLNSFYEWYKGLGGEVVKSNYLNISRELNSITLQVSTFKNRPQEVKELYNHKF